jgi:hypothetical protein
MTIEERQILEEIREQNREILRLLRGEGDGGLTAAMLAAAPDPIAAIRARNRQVKARQKGRRSL